MLCKWYFTEWRDDNKWLAQSNCGQSREVTRWENFFKKMYNGGPCPGCHKPITVGEEM